LTTLFSAASCERALRRERTDLSARRRKQIKCKFREKDGDNAGLERAFTPIHHTPLTRRLRAYLKKMNW